jgi:CO dehydrogenase maturation factor
LILIVESDRKTLETAKRTLALARELGIERVLAVANRVHDDDSELIRAGLPSELPIIGSIPYVDALRVAARRGGLPDNLTLPPVSELLAQLERLFALSPS